MGIHSFSTVEELIEQIEQLQKENQDLLEENDELYADNRGLKEELDHLKQEYDELDSRLGDMEDLKTEIADERDAKIDELDSLQNKYDNDMDVAHSGALSVIEDFQTLLDFIEEHHEEVYFTIRMNPDVTATYNVDEYDHARSWDKRIAFGYRVIEGKS